MKVIFLDIDGVMNSELFYRKRYKRRWLKPITYWYRIKAITKYIFNGFKTKYTPLNLHKISKNFGTLDYTYKRLLEETDQQKWKWLSEFCNENDYKICISSVWKNSFKNPADWGIALERLGFKKDIYVGITGKNRTLRGDEIKDWVDKHNVEKYAILDDDSDMLPEQLYTCYFQVDPYFGLTPNHLYRINRYFMAV